MRKVLIVTIVIAVLLILTGCSISFPLPEQGIYYCEELNMAIDFYAIENYEDYDYGCIRRYNKDKSYELLDCHIDFGCGIYIYKLDAEGNENYIINATFRYWKDEFRITDVHNKTKYTFVKICDDWSQFETLMNENSEKIS